MMRSRLLAAFALGSLLLFAGCKQDVGERCESASDCASGFCGGDNSVVGTASAIGKTCTPGRVTTTQDAGNGAAGAGTPGDAAADRADGADAPGVETGDVASETHAEAGEAGTDTPAQGGTDAHDGAPAEAGAETSASDGAADLATDTAAGS